jgi:hypothetical protein
MISLLVLTIVLTKRVHADSDEMEKVLFEMWNFNIYLPKVSEIYCNLKFKILNLNLFRFVGFGFKLIEENDINLLYFTLPSWSNIIKLTESFYKLFFFFLLINKKR